jgi:excisionase family DNA binding protein
MMALTIPAPRGNTADARHTTQTDTAQADAGTRALYRVPEAMRLLSLSRSVIYTQIRTGRLRSVKQGSSRLIPADAIDDYVALLEAEAEASR